MSDHAPSDPGKLKRQKRLEEQLRENLKRRKEQARGRREETRDDAPSATGEGTAEDREGREG